MIDAMESKSLKEQKSKVIFDTLEHALIHSDNLYRFENSLKADEVFIALMAYCQVFTIVAFTKSNPSFQFVSVKIVINSLLTNGLKEKDVLRHILQEIPVDRKGDHLFPEPVL